MMSFTTCDHCTDSFSSFHQPLVDLIVNAAKPEKIFLLGASLCRRNVESIFNQQTLTSQHISECFLLILKQDLDNKELHEWQDKIENICKSLMAVTVIVLQTVTFEEWLKAEHKFACTVRKRATLLYNAGNLPWTVPEVITTDVSNKECERQYVEGLAKAKEFLAGSELFQVRKQHAMAAFMLHQSAEQALRTLLQIGTGFHANTHNLDKLIRYASLISPHLPDIFPQKTDQQKRLFSLLQRAYIDARYAEEYKICSGDLVCLTDKVRYIHKILADVGKHMSNSAVSSSIQ